MKQLLIFFLLAGITATAQEKMVWPQHKKAAIVLTYDDALQSQLKVAVRQLKAAHLMATFFITGDINNSTIPQWRALSKQGYELGNHTIFHPCSITDDNPVSSEKYTPYSMIREIDVMNHFLFAVDGKIPKSYAYPCTETLAGGRDYVDTLRKYGMVKYARLGGDGTSVITDFKNLDLLQVPSFGVDEGTTGAQLIAFVKLVQQKGGMGVIMLHGIGGDYITISAEAHQQLISYLSQNRKNLWITTFKNAMDHVVNASKRQVVIKQCMKL